MYDARIILGGQAPNVLGALFDGTRAAQANNQAQTENRLASLYQAQGPQIMAGQPSAMNALASIDPTQAINIQNVQQGMQAQTERLGIAREEMALRREDGKRLAAQYVAGLSEADRVKQQAELERGLAGAAAFYAKGDRPGFDSWIASHGLDPQTYSWDNAQGWMASADGVLAAYKEFKPEDRPDPMTDAGKAAFDAQNGWTQPGATPQADPKEVDKFRQEFSGLPMVKGFAVQAEAYRKLRAAAKDPSPAGDLALIFAYMKLQDPGSTVREGEFANAQNSGSLDQQLVARYNSILNGTRLSDEQRADFVDRSERLYQASEDQYSFLSDQFSAIAKDRGYDPGAALIDFRFKGDRGPLVTQPAQSQVTTQPAQSQATPEFLANPTVVESARQNGISPQDIWDHLDEASRLELSK